MANNDQDAVVYMGIPLSSLTEKPVPDVTDKFLIETPDGPRVSKWENVIEQVTGGWNIVAEEIEDGERVVKKIASFTGGVPPLPQALTDLVGKYFAAGGGFTSDISLATNYKGTSGEDGKGITSISKTSTVGEVDTYTITFSDASTITYSVTNGTNAKLPLYSAIKSANIAAGTQFIDDENGNIIYRVKTGQTLLTTDLPANVLGVKVEKTGVTDTVISTISTINTAGYYTYTTGTPTATANNLYTLTDKIEVKKGDSLIITYRQHTDATLGVWLYPLIGQNEKLTPTTVGTFTYKINIVKDGFIRVSSYDYIPIIKKETYLYAKPSDIKNTEVSDLLKSVNIAPNDIQFTQVDIGIDNAYVNSSKVQTTYNKAKLTSKITLNKGDVIIADVYSEPNIALFVVYDAAGTIQSVNMGGVSEGTRVIRSYTAKSDVEYIRIGYYVGANNVTAGQRYLLIQNPKILYPIKQQVIGNLGQNIRHTNLITNGAVSFIDDDGDKDVYAWMYPEFRARGLKFGTAIVTNLIKAGARGALLGGTTATMTLEEVKFIAADLETVEILNHTYNHERFYENTAVSRDVLEKSNNWFLDNLGILPEGFVYPFGQSSVDSVRVLHKYHNFAFSTVSGLNDVNSISNFQIKRMNFGSDGATIAALKAAIDDAKANNKWLIIMTHINGYNTYANWKTDLQEILDYVVSSGIKCMKPTDAFYTFGNIMEAENGFKMNAKGVITVGT